MVAILSSSIENADRLSDSLQLYWNSHGVYRSIVRFETVAEFMDVMARYKCECVVLEGTQELSLLIGQIRAIKHDCKIAVITNQRDPAADNKAALICHDFGVELLVTRTDIERPLELISKQLHIV